MCIACGKEGKNLCEECSGKLSPLTYAKAYLGDALIERFNSVFGKEEKIELETLGDYGHYLELLGVPLLPIKPSILLTTGEIRVLNLGIEKIKSELPNIDASGANFLLRLASVYCIKEKNGDAPIILAKLVLKFEPENINATLVAGFGNILLGQISEASQLFDLVLQKQPQNAPAWYGKALVMKCVGRWGASVQFLNEAIKRDEKFYLAYVEKAKILLSQGRIDEANRVVDEAIRVMPQESHAWALKAEILNAGGKWGGAYQCLNQAISLDPLNTDYLLEQAKLLLSHGKKAEARELLIEILDYQKSEEAEKLLKECE